MERTDQYRMVRRVLMADVSGVQLWERPRLGWMDGVKVSATEEWLWRLRVNVLKIGKSVEPWYICNWMSFTWPFMFGPVLFRTALPCSGGYHLERGGMPLHDVIGLNCKKGTILKIKVQMLSIWAKGFMSMIVCVIWLDMTTPPRCRAKVMVYYYYL